MVCVDAKIKTRGWHLSVLFSEEGNKLIYGEFYLFGVGKFFFFLGVLRRNNGLDCLSFVLAFSLAAYLTKSRHIRTYEERERARLS